MRAIDLAMFIIILEMSIGFLGSTGDVGLNLYGTHGDYLRRDMSEYSINAQKNTSLGDGLAKTSAPTIADYFLFGAQWLFAGINFFIQIATAFLAISFTLQTKFGIPFIPIGAFVQGIVYLIYMWAIVQWKSGRGGGSFD